MSAPQRALLAVLLVLLAFLVWLMLSVLDRQAADGAQRPVGLIPPVAMVRDTSGVVTTDRPSLLRWPAARSFLRPPLAHVPTPTGSADPSTKAGGTPTPQASAVSPAGTRSPDADHKGKVTASGPSGDLKARIAWCESRDNPRAVNKTSGASGLYQFLDSTWHNVTGLPGKAADYPPAVQSAAFDALYTQQGARPWDASKTCWSKP